ncbi:MAG TPA: hypothetical protein VFE62_05010 [Gemmataceae bacterium]|nr:hypothetical protein [Gemmataceae bacterium]
MKGFIKHSAAVALFGAGLLAVIGCDCYRSIVDPCWPERYNSIARKSVRDMANAQADKGHILEQTVWNWHWEADPKTGAASDRLNPAGMAVLQRISRTLPCPDFQLYLQNAQDIPYVEGVPPEKLVRSRNELNDRRAAAIQRFMATQAALHGGGNFQVAVHDFAPTSLPAYWPTTGEDRILMNVKNLIPQNFIQPPVNK